MVLQLYIYTSTIYIYNYIYIYGYNVFHRPHPVFSSILYVHVSEMLCACQRCCARFPAVVHVSQKLCTHKPPNNVRVQLYTHWAHSNQQKHWGDQSRSPDIHIIYIYIYLHTRWSGRYIRVCKFLGKTICVCGSAIGGAAYCAKAVLRGHIMFRVSLTWPTLAYLLYNIIYVLGVAKQCHKLRQTLPGK